MKGNILIYLYIKDIYAKAIEKNDFYMKRLCFAQTKTDDKKLEIMIHKWDNLLNQDTNTDDKDLIKFMNRKDDKNDIKIE